MVQLRRYFKILKYSFKYKSTSELELFRKYLEPFRTFKNFLELFRKYLEPASI